MRQSSLAKSWKFARSLPLEAVHLEMNLSISLSAASTVMRRGPRKSSEQPLTNKTIRRRAKVQSCRYEAPKPIAVLSRPNGTFERAIIC
jgi:hypothetical protein